MRWPARLAGIGAAAALLVVASAGMAASSVRTGPADDWRADKGGVAVKVGAPVEWSVLVSNLDIGGGGANGIQRALHPGRSGLAQAFTTGTHAGGYVLGSLGIQISGFTDPATAGAQLAATINDVAPGGGPGAALCTLTNPSSLSASPAVSTFEGPADDGACPQLAADTVYFAVIEWTQPSGTGNFAWIPQTVPFEDHAATEEDPGGAAGWSIADTSHYLDASTGTGTWAEFDETASFKIAIHGTTAPETDTPALTATIAAAPESHDGQSEFTFEVHFSEEFPLSYKVLREEGAFTVTNGEITKARRLEPGKNIKREIHIRPDGDANVTIVLPATTDCDTTGAICTADGRMLSNRSEVTVSGPGQ